jgi:hypothetical protein
MKSGILSRCLIAATLAIVTAAVRAEVKDNPYQTIIQRNAFALREPPPPPPPATNNAADTPPPVDVKITGITDLLGPVKVFLQLQNSQTKKFDYLSMEVGERQGDIEVLSIDKENGVVRIRHGDAETSLDFEHNGVKPVAAAGGTPGSPVPPPPHMTPLNAPAPFNNPGNHNVSVSGGYTAPSTASGLSSAIPARPLRSESANNVLIGGNGMAANPNPTPQPHVAPNQSAEEVMRDIEARRQLMLQKEQQGQVPRGMSSILPPTKYSPPPAPIPAPGGR